MAKETSKTTAPSGCMTKRDVLRLYNGLGAVADLSGTTSWNYACAKTRRMIETEAQAIAAAIKPSKDFARFTEKRLELCREHSLTSDNGKPLMDDGDNFQIADWKAFNKEIDKLKKKHTKTIEAREKQAEKYEELLDEDADVQLHLVNLDDVHEEITPGQLEAIFPMVSENGVT